MADPVVGGTDPSSIDARYEAMEARQTENALKSAERTAHMTEITELLESLKEAARIKV
ncbi:MAG: hypothetical protein V4805_17110 [Pseudomonadota bacterium]